MPIIKENLAGNVTDIIFTIEENIFAQYANWLGMFRIYEGQTPKPQKKMDILNQKMSSLKKRFPELDFDHPEKFKKLSKKEQERIREILRKKVSEAKSSS